MSEGIFDKAYQSFLDVIKQGVTKSKLEEAASLNIRIATSVMAILEDVERMLANPDQRMAIMRVPELAHVITEVEYTAKRDRHAGMGYIRQSVVHSAQVMSMLPSFIKKEFHRDTLNDDEISYAVQQVHLLLWTTRSWYRYITLAASMMRCAVVDFTHPDIKCGVKELFTDAQRARVKEGLTLLLTKTRQFAGSPDSFMEALRKLPTTRKQRNDAAFVGSRLASDMRLVSLTTPRDLAATFDNEKEVAWLSHLEEQFEAGKALTTPVGDRMALAGMTGKYKRLQKALDSAESAFY